MPKSVIQFVATRVECSEAIDWQFARVIFDTMGVDFNEEDRTSPYLMLSADLEFSDRVQVEFHDGEDYAGDWIGRIDLWRNRAIALSARGHQFDITFELSDEAFAELRDYLRVLMRADCFREQ